MWQGNRRRDPGVGLGSRRKPEPGCWRHMTFPDLFAEAY